MKLEISREDAFEILECLKRIDYDYREDHIELIHKIRSAISEPGTKATINRLGDLCYFED
jgi:hypothetical protein